MVAPAMRFPFNERKAAQSAAYLLRLHGGRLNYMALIKLLYLADRQALIECGTTITGDRPFSLPHGPVLSMILDRISMGRDEQKCPWFDYVSEAQGYEVSLMEASPSSDELSTFETELLGAVHRQFGHLNQWQLRLDRRE
jgi:hypothetical protein